MPLKSRLAKEIRDSKLGVVWHTVYRGDSFENMTASFGENIADKLKTTKTVWSTDATFRDISGTATFTTAETAVITKILSDAGKIFAKTPASTLNGLSDNEDLRLRVNTFINVKVRSGQRIGNPSIFVADLIRYIEDYYQKEADKKKTPKGKQSSFDKRDDVLQYFKNNNMSDIIGIFKMYNLIDEAKLIIIAKLNKVEGLKTLLKTKDGFEVTGQEGFVAIDHVGKNALKLVDRLGFSKANFSPEYLKGWQR